MIKSEFDNLIEKIESKLNFYKSYYGKDNKYRVYLANGKILNYSLNENNIAHLLGINVDAIRNKYNLKKSSIEIIEYIIENSYSIYKTIQEGNLSYSNIFSSYIEAKLEIFEEQLNFVSNIDEIEFVCEFDPSKCYLDGEIIEHTADYYIAKRNEENDLILLGLVKNGDFYHPQTSQVIKNENF